MPSSHSKQEEEWKETHQRTSPQFVEKDRRGNSSMLHRKKNCRVVLQFRAVGCFQGNCCPPCAAVMHSSAMRNCKATSESAHLEIFRLQLQAAETSVLSPWMIQGTWALNRGLNSPPAIWGWCTKVWTFEILWIANLPQANEILCLSNQVLNTSGHFQF